MFIKGENTRGIGFKGTPISRVSKLAEDDQHNRQ